MVNCGKEIEIFKVFYYFYFKKIERKKSMNIKKTQKLNLKQET